MGFVNEYLPAEDVEKFQLDKIWLKEHPVEKTIPKHVRLHWTVDRDRDAFLMRVAIGREEESNRATFIFYWEGEFFRTKLDRGSGGSKSYKERPYRIVWELIDIWPLQSKSETREKVLGILKEAMTAFGDEGVRSYVTGTIVEFKNF